MRAVIYSRVSTDGQEKNGTSLETQEAECLAYAEREGWTVVDCIRETGSAFTLDRLGLERVRQLVRGGQVEVVLEYDPDRLSRNQPEVGVLFTEMKDAGVKLHFVTTKVEDSALGYFMLMAQTFAAQQEREKIMERTTRGKLARAREGRIPQGMGRGTYGYVYNSQTKQREIEPYQAEIVRRIFQRYAETRSFSKISNELNDKCVSAFLGGRWYPLTIRRMLQNESYTGRLIFQKTKWVTSRTRAGKMVRRPTERPVEEHIEIPGASPAIVDRVLFERVQTVLNDPARTTARPSPRVYGLRGRAKCGVCGSAIVGQTIRVKGNEYRYYRCRHAYDRRLGYTCNTSYVRADRLEQRIWDEVSKVLSAPVVVLALLRRHLGGGARRGVW